MITRIKTILITLLLFSSSQQIHAHNLTYHEAVQRTLNLSPRLRISETEVESKAGDSVQTKLLPNPLAGWSVENLFGNKE